MLMGIDVGGTKTHVRVEFAGEQLLDAVLPTVQWRIGGLIGDDQNAARLLAWAQEHVDDDISDAALVIGAHGLDSARQIEDFRLQLVGAHRGPVRAVNDAELLVPAAGLDSGIAVVAGTGSKVIGRTVEGETVAVGGWGYLVGDPGSAPALTFAAVRAATLAHDAGAADDVVTDELMRHFGAADLVALADRYNDSPNIHAWGEAAGIVFDAAEAGSPIADAVIADAAAQLARDVRIAVGRGATGSHIVCAGGVIVNQPRLLDALTEALSALGLSFSTLVLDAPPVGGAVRMARQLLASVA
ncbi:BadF/BadG/BcrA/BcrD ATPase family protein [Microbacterium gorillae]|uniref:BadF/BadG/BcrA/BcrD ATPase family protein n=1 Tax=Microbacterium gorillae TaxID=1231063 RepID=UPI0005918298|nr:BadF/BadG/BcrA/BcrD ATPase family protein [Microbacterium gorillae]